MRHLDTAFAYGDGASESMVGRVVANMKLRDQVVIATKELTPWQRRRLASDKAKEALVRMAEASLARLKSDYVDILYVHDISTVEEVRHPGFMEALQQLKRQGKVRFVGFSSHGNMAACLDEAVRLGVYDVVLVAWNYALAEDAALRASMQKAAEKGIGLVAMKTQCSQYWYSQDLPDEQRRFYDGKGMHSAMLKWAVQHPFIATAVPGFTTFQQFDEDWAVASNLAFTPAEKRFFEERKIKVSLGYCVQCGACKPSCRNGADVPALMRVHMYLSCYGNFEVARRALQGVPGGAGISACASCGDCAARCVRDVPVEARIKDLRTLLG
jgi:predicted aldo/keto reductase-like oxidoreductase